MIAFPGRHVGRNLTWKIALLPLLAVVTTAALELALGGGRIATEPSAVAAAPLAPDAGAGTPPPAAKTRAPFSAPAGVAVRGSTVYISDVATNTIWSRDLETGAETLIAGSLGSGYSGDGGPAADAQLTGPRGLVVDA